VERNEVLCNSPRARCCHNRGSFSDPNERQGVQYQCETTNRLTNNATPSDFITSELWLVDSTYPNPFAFVEAGAITGYGGSRRWFWAERCPNGSGSLHNTGLGFSLGSTYTAATPKSQPQTSVPGIPRSTACCTSCRRRRVLLRVPRLVRGGRRPCPIGRKVPRFWPASGRLQRTALFKLGLALRAIWPVVARSGATSKSVFLAGNSRRPTQTQTGHCDQADASPPPDAASPQRSSSRDVET
jgi:hypothetical protein